MEGGGDWRVNFSGDDEGWGSCEGGGVKDTAVGGMAAAEIAANIALCLLAGLAIPVQGLG